MQAQFPKCWGTSQVLLPAMQWKTAQCSCPHPINHGLKGLWARSTSSQKNQHDLWFKDWHGTSAKTQYSIWCCILPTSCRSVMLSAPLVASLLLYSSMQAPWSHSSAILGVFLTHRTEPKHLISGHMASQCKNRIPSLVVFTSWESWKHWGKKSDCSVSPLASMTALRTGQRAQRQHPAARHAGKGAHRHEAPLLSSKFNLE